jgi:hypothetical protein
MVGATRQANRISYIIKEMQKYYFPMTYFRGAMIIFPKWCATNAQSLVKTVSNALFWNKQDFSSSEKHFSSLLALNQGGCCGSEFARLLPLAFAVAGGK